MGYSYAFPVEFITSCLLEIGPPYQKTVSNLMWLAISIPSQNKQMHHHSSFSPKLTVIGAPFKLRQLTDKLLHNDRAFPTSFCRERGESSWCVQEAWHPYIMRWIVNLLVGNPCRPLPPAMKMKSDPCRFPPHLFLQKPCWNLGLEEHVLIFTKTSLLVCTTDLIYSNF